MPDAELVTYVRVDGLHGWRLVHRNGDILANDSGQGYANKAEAITIGNRVVSGHYLREDVEPDADSPLDAPTGDG